TRCCLFIHHVTFLQQRSFPSIDIAFLLAKIHLCDAAHAFVLHARDCELVATYVDEKLSDLRQSEMLTGHVACETVEGMEGEGVKAMGQPNIDGMIGHHETVESVANN